MRTAAELRADFLLDPDIAHLNHGSYGAMPPPVLGRQQELRDALERDPVEFLGRRLPEVLAGVRATLATYLAVADPDRLVLVANSTTGLNAVAPSLPLTAADEIVITDREYGAMQLLWEEVARRTGARLVVAQLPLPAVDAAELADAVWSAVTPRTRVLFFSHVTSETALVLPAAELCRRARDAGVISVVDGAHAPGQLPLALDELGADCYAGNGHKWLCAPKGSAFLYVRDELRRDASADRRLLGLERRLPGALSAGRHRRPDGGAGAAGRDRLPGGERLGPRPGSLPRARPTHADRDRRAARQRPHRSRGAPGTADGGARGAGRRYRRRSRATSVSGTASRFPCGRSTGEPSRGFRWLPTRPRTTAAGSLEALTVRRNAKSR